MICMMLFGVFWAAYLVISRFMPAGYSIFEVLWGRYALHVLLTLVVLGPARGIAILRTTRPHVQFWRGILMVVTSVSAVLAASGMGLDTVRAALWFAPLFVIALDQKFRGVRYPPLMWAACAICLMGTVFILKPSVSHNVASLFWAVLTLVSFTGYQTLTASLRVDPPTTSVFYSGLITLIPMSAILPWVWKLPTPFTWAVFFGMGLAGWLSLLFLDVAIHDAEPGGVVVFGYIHFVAEVLLASIIVRARPNLMSVLGCAFIVAGLEVARRTSSSSAPALKCAASHSRRT